MPAPPELLDLVQRFKCNLDQYKRSSYNETQVRVDYIDPFFELLGWDVHNRQGFAEQYRDVLHIESTDAQINRLVYELYELSAEEIAIVEGGV